jgi:chaperonin GroES
MATNIRPLHDHVFVRRIAEGEQARGGIIIPDTARERPQEGEVVAVGEGKYRTDGVRQSLDVRAGDRVLFGKYSGSEIKLDGEELLIMREDEIFGVVERAGAVANSGGGKKGGK